MQIAILIKNLLMPFHQDLFAIESFELIDEDDGLKNLRVKYRFRGKRKVVMTKMLTEIITDKKLLPCFSREDNFELGMWYGRIKNTNLHFSHKVT